ncbi:MAG: L,D-transpeptidase [Ignavibacteriae bacterium]|nr:murein L,D-transpeptidase [Ignavibacteriota bacterium]NOG97258.1 L,D-transpeptidase [Ignavibacteriota bacterium]
MLKNIIYFGVSIILFFAGVIVYGIILNIREDTLAEAMDKKGIEDLGDVYLLIDKKNFTIELFSDSMLVKKYKAAFGNNSSPVKTSLDDNVTPTGNFIICNRDTAFLYHKLLQINYPNFNQISEFYKNNYIDRDEYKKLIAAVSEYDFLPEEGFKKQRIGIHGIGEYNLIFKNLPFAFNWTNGSIAVSNEDIDELYTVTNIGTKVEIR